MMLVLMVRFSANMSRVSVYVDPERDEKLV